MACNRSRVWADLERMTAEIANGTRTPLVEFRDEPDEWEFHTEMRWLDMRAMLWKMTEQLKIMNKFMDR